MKKSAKSFKRQPPPRRRPIMAKSRPTPFQIDTPPNKRFVFRSELLERLSITYPTLWRWMRDGRFPTPQIIGGSNAWLESEVDHWMTSQPRRVYDKKAEV